MFTPTGAESVSTIHFLDGGFTFRLTNDLQLDVRAGKGISGLATDYFVGSGSVVSGEWCSPSLTLRVRV